MFDEKEIPVADEEVEEAESAATEVSAEESAPSAVETIPEIRDINYLDPALFDEVRVVSRGELDTNNYEGDVPADIEMKYISTFSDISENQVITGRVVGMNEKEVLIDIGFKSEGIIDRSEFQKKDLPNIGDQMDVFLEYIEDESGNTVLSKEKADFMRRWADLKTIFANEETISGRIVRRIKGGMVVDLGVVQAFLPGSQIDVRPIQDFDKLLDQDIEVRIVKLNEARKNVVVSHKVILEESLKEQREELYQQLEIGKILEGRVKNITDFGVFIDLGGVDGLLHITDLSWGRVNHPSEMVELNETLTVKVIEYDEEKRRVSLGLKQLTPHPWENVEGKYPVGTVIQGKVVSMTNYGAFVEIEPGVEGLIHVSEMSWTRHVKNPSEIFSMGDDVDAMVLSIDSNERKISLGAKQLQPDPWDEIEEKYIIGTIHEGKVINLTQFGAFVELEEGIDGLIHVSDLSWTKVVRHPREIVEKGQDIKVRIMEVSRESRRISLSLKQVTEDPWPEIITHFETGRETTGTVIRVLEKGIILQLEMDVEGIVPFGNKSKRERKSVASQYKPGDTLTGNIMEVRPDEKKVTLFVEKLSGADNASKKDEVQEYLDSQNDPAGEKIEIPAELASDSDPAAEGEDPPVDSP